MKNLCPEKVIGVSYTFTKRQVTSNIDNLTQKHFTCAFMNI